MSEPKAPDAQQLGPNELWERFRTAMALNRGIELVEEFASKGKESAEHSVVKREKYLGELYLQTHGRLFQDTKGHPSDAERAGEIVDPEKREIFRLTIQKLVKDVFDDNGFVKQQDDFASKLSDAYIDLRELKPFNYGNQETLNLFMVMLSRLPAVKEVYPHEIDFRRLEKNDLDALTHGGKNEVMHALEHAMDSTRSQGLPNKANELPAWPSQEYRIAGIPLVKYHDDKENKDYMVLANGGLIEINQQKERQVETLLTTGSLLTDVRFKPEKYLPDYENNNGHSAKKRGNVSYAELKDKPFIDGIAITAEGSPLLCLDINPITGLRPPAQRQFEQYFDQQLGRDPQTGKKRDIYYLNDNPDAMRKLMDGAPENLKHTLEVACAGIDAATDKLDAARDAIVAETKATSITNGHKKHFVMSMGGAGTGKTQAEKVMEAYAGDDHYVKASLDDARYYSDTYKVLCAANHHADDYITVEPFASTLRNWVAAKALENNYNILYDGTGMPYKGRYDDIAKRYKDNKYHTVVCGIDTMLAAPAGREEEYNDNSIQRVQNRYNDGDDRRALPWPVIVGKHAKTMASFMDAVNDQFVDKAVMFSTDGPKGSAYVVAETYDHDIHSKTPEKLRATLRNENTQALQAEIHDWMRGEQSVVNQQAQASGKQADDFINRIPKAENNVGFIARRVAGKDRVLAITNVVRMIDLAEKGLMNSHASGASNMNFKPGSLAFDVPDENRRDEADPARRLATLRPEQLQRYISKVMEAYNAAGKSVA